MKEGRALSSFSLFTVLSVAFVWLFEASAIGPALGAIAEAFPEASELQIKNVMTAPFLTSIVFSAISGRLASKYDKKWILVVGLFLYGVTGMLPAYASDINHIIVLRLLTGVGVGLVLPITNIYISEYFEGAKRERMLGLALVIANLANVFNGIFVGFLQAYSWKYPFLSFGIVFLFMVLVMVGAPSVRPEKAAGPQTGERVNLPGSIYRYAVSMTLLWVFFAFITVNCALFMVTEKIGEPWMIGIAASFPAIGSIVIGAVFPEVRRLLGHLLVPVGLLVFAAGFATLYGAQTVTTIAIGSFLIGLGQGAIVPYVFELTAQAAPSDRVKDRAFGIVSGCIHVGLLISPFAQEALLLLNEKFRFVDRGHFRELFLMAAVLVAVAGLVALFVQSKRLDRKSFQ
ncbi:MAG: hypothetical protein DI589_15085 [Shinella sp.]|nr:MAG: hypothetical protein DI589_15085 [Shinella sp.]